MTLEYTKNDRDVLEVSKLKSRYVYDPLQAGFSRLRFQAKKNIRTKGRCKSIVIGRGTLSFF